MEHYAPLAFWDWAIIIAFFAISMGIGMYYSRQAQGSMTEYFVAGRKMTWWLAGTSIVATSFAADTPLVISGWVRTSGLEKNWFWWGGIMGMMLCTFFFARLWRRANILTDVEFNELRYSGKPAAGLRIFHASYRSIAQNTLVMGWVTLAMVKILEVTLNIPTLVFVKGELFPVVVAKGIEVTSVLDVTTISTWPLYGTAIIPAKVTGIVLCMGTAVIYTAISGLWGVMVTDFFQFVLAMTGCIVLMFAVFWIAGGPTELVAKAREAVEQGRVINKPPEVRAELSAAKLADAFGSASGPPSAPKGDLQKSEAFQGLVASGLFRPDPSGKITWTASGLTEARVAARLKAAGIRRIEPVLELWREAYAMRKARFTDFGAVERALDAGVLVQDREPSGKPLDYYRLPELSITEAAFFGQLNSAGIEDRSELMAAWRKDAMVTPSKITSFLPPFDLKGGGLMAVWSIIVFLGLQWWGGGEGGGFLAQRLFSCKDEKHSVLAMLWFNFANFVLRPWPWIVVGVASLFLIPDITAYGAHYDQEYAYVVMLMKFLPVGLKGLLVAALMAAYMSTIATQINFGASYVVNDLYQRFLDKGCSDHKAVVVSQIASIVLGLMAAAYAYFSTSIATGWFTVFEIMSGAGFVVLLRWYWWRINAWSELSAMSASLMMFALLNWTTVFQALFQWVGAPTYLLDEYAVRFTLNMFVSTIIWVSVTFLTPPEKEQTLVRFYRRIRPAGWWKAIAAKAGNPHHLNVGWLEWTCWALGVVSLFAGIVSVGKACFGFYPASVLYGAVAAVSAVFIFVLMRRMDWSAVADAKPAAETAEAPPMELGCAPEFRVVAQAASEPAHD